MFKDLVQFPQPNKHIMAAGGIKGMHDTLSPSARPLGVLANAVNLRRWGPTGAATRLGRVQYASTMPDPTPTPSDPPLITGMTSYYFGESGTASLIVGYYDKLYYSTAVSTDIVFNPMPGTGGEHSFYPNAQWTSAIFDNPTLPAATRADEVLIITNGKEAVWKWNGRTTIVEAVGGNPPHAKYVCVAHGRVFLAHITETIDGLALPSGIYVSALGALEIWPDSATSADDATYEDNVNGNDGDHITWIQLYQNNVVIWKKHTVWEWQGVGENPPDNWRLTGIGGPGCVNGRTIIQIDGVLYWLSYEGVVRWSGGKIEVISNPTINATMTNIDWAEAESSAFATYDNEGNYILTVPSATGLASTSMTIVFCTKDASWWMWTGWSPEAYVRHRAAGAGEDVYMASGRQAYKMGGDPSVPGSEYLDDGVPIESEAHFGPSAGESTFKNKLMRRAYFVLSGDDDSVVEAQTSRGLTEPPQYDTAVTLDMNTSAAEARHWTGRRCYLPFTSGIGESIRSYAPRMLLSGTGRIIIHDVALEYSERES